MDEAVQLLSEDLERWVLFHDVLACLCLTMSFSSVADKDKRLLCAQKWSSGKDIRNALIDLSTTSAKGSHFLAFRRYVYAYERNKEILWGEYTKGRWANQRMRLYGGKKRSFARFLNEMQTVKDTMRKDKRGKIVVAYGAGRFPSSGPGKKSAPVTTVL